MFVSTSHEGQYKSLIPKEMPPQGTCGGYLEWGTPPPRLFCAKSSSQRTYGWTFCSNTSENVQSLQNKGVEFTGARRRNRP